MTGLQQAREDLRDLLQDMDYKLMSIKYLPTQGEYSVQIEVNGTILTAHEKTIAKIAESFIGRVTPEELNAICDAIKDSIMCILAERDRFEGMIEVFTNLPGELAVINVDMYVDAEYDLSLSIYRVYFISEIGNEIDLKVDLNEIVRRVK